MVDISQYVERLERLKAKKQSTLTQDELKEIARELGWTDEELAEVEAQAQTHLERGNNFFRRELWEEAVKEYREAQALAPINIAVAGQLAIACLQIWKSSKSSADHHQAEFYARAALDLDPSYQPAYEALKELQKKKPSKTLMGLAAALVLMLGVMMAVIVLVPSPEEEPRKSPKESAVSEKAPTISSPVTTGDFPVDFQSVKNLKLKLTARTTKQSNYESGSFFAYGWLLENQSDQEIQVLKGKIDLLNAKGEVMHSAETRVLDTHQGKLRPGDFQGFSSTVKSHPSVVKAVLRLEEAETMPAASRYDAGETVDVVWDVKKPSNAGITVREREQSSDDVVKGKPFAFFRGTWELTNSGEKSFELLRVRIALLGPNGEEVDSSAPYVVGPSAPYLAAGESRLLATTRSIKQPVTGYRIHVSEFR